MKILLVGEYSRLHLTLMEKLRGGNNQVLLVSDGDGYKNYYRDIDIRRTGHGAIGIIRDYIRIIKTIRSLKDFDIVQLINPCFTTLNVRVNKWLYKRLARQNKKIFLGAFGVDYVWLNVARDKDTFRYSEFHIFQKEIKIAYSEKIELKWNHKDFASLNKYIATNCKGIIACLYEYYIAYKKQYPDKVKYIPLPIDTYQLKYESIVEVPTPIIFFVGIDKDRNQFKGTDLLLKMLEQLKTKYPDQVEINIAESVSYNVYIEMLTRAHVVLDQIYSYSPSINPLQAMAMGKIVVSGGEPEIYDLLDENIRNKPIFNVLPTEESIFSVLEQIVVHKEYIPKWSSQSRRFVEQYHDANKVTNQYLEYWNQ